MVVWEDRGMLKPPKPPIVHATGLQQSVSLSVCLYSESTHLDAMALCLCHGQPQHNKVVVLNLTDFDVKASLSNKSEQKLKILNLHVGSQLLNYTRPLFEAPYIFTAEVIPYQERWKRVAKIESQNCVWLAVSVADCQVLLQEPYFSETPSFFAVIHSAYIYVPLKLSICFIAPELLCMLDSSVIHHYMHCIISLFWFLLIMSPASRGFTLQCSSVMQLWRPSTEASAPAVLLY